MGSEAKALQRDRNSGRSRRGYIGDYGTRNEIEGRIEKIQYLQVNRYGS